MNEDQTTPPVRRCWPFTHRWSKWKDTDYGACVSYDDSANPLRVGSYIIQERRCETCGKVQLHTARS